MMKKIFLYCIILINLACSRDYTFIYSSKLLVEENENQLILSDKKNTPLNGYYQILNNSSIGLAFGNTLIKGEIVNGKFNGSVKIYSLDMKAPGVWGLRKDKDYYEKAYSILIGELNYKEGVLNGKCEANNKRAKIISHFKNGEMTYFMQYNKKSKEKISSEDEGFDRKKLEKYSDLFKIKINN